MASQFVPQLSLCQANNCSELVVCDTSTLGTYAYSDITEVILNVTSSADPTYTTGDLDITTTYTALMTGVVTANGSTAIVGAGTAFLSEIVAGDELYIVATDELIEVASVGSDTGLTLTEVASATIGSAIYRIRRCYTLAPSDMTYTDTTFPDGVYSVTLTITTSDTVEHERTGEFYFDCHTKCGVYKLLAGINERYDCNNCDDTYINNALMAYGLWRSMRYDIARCRYTEAANIQATLERIFTVYQCNC